MDEEQDTLGEEIDLQSPKRGKGTMGKGARRKALPATYEPGAIVRSGAQM